MANLDWTMRAMAAFPATLDALLAEVPPSALDWQPPSWEGIPSETLTIRQQICHLRDIEADGYIVRFTRVLREPDPVLESIDTYALVAARAYDRTDIGDAHAVFAEARRRTMELLKSVAPSDLSRRGEFEGYGKVTLLGLIHYLCSHDQQHLAGIQWLLGKHAGS